MQATASHQHAQERRYGPEVAIADEYAMRCVCDAKPLMISTNDGFYCECPPCRARTLTVRTSKAARSQWNGMLYALRRFS